MVYIPALDGLRFTAFLLVFIHHVLGFYVTSRPDEHSGRISLMWFVIWHTGAYGVQLFFVLSSFLISTLLLQERIRFGQIDLKSFYIRRSLRIWPLYYTVLVGTTLWQLNYRSLDFTSLLGFTFFYGNWIVPLKDSYSSYLWTLSVEEQFYFVAPFGARIVKRPVHWCLFLIALSVISRVFLVFFGNWKLEWYSTFTNLDSFAIGSLLAVYLHRRPFKHAISAGAVYVTFALVLMVDLAVSYNGSALDRQLSPSVGSQLEQILVPIGWALTIYSCIRAGSRTVFSSWTFTNLGRISFGLYLFHEPVLLHLFLRIFPGTDGPGQIAKVAFLSLLITIGLAKLSYHLVELPFLRHKARFTRVRSGATL